MPPQSEQKNSNLQEGESRVADVKETEEKAKERAHKSKIARKIILYTVSLVGVLIALNFALTYLRQSYSIDIFYTYYPIAYASIVAYAFSVLGFFLKGSLATIIIGNVKILAIVAAFLLGLYSAPIALPLIAKMASWWIVITASIYVAHKLVYGYSKPMSVLTLSFFILVMGYGAETLTPEILATASLGIFALPKNLLFFSFLIPALLSLLSVFRYSQNNYLDFLGKQLSSHGTLAFAGICVFLLGLFELNLKPTLTAPLSTYFILIEWGAVCGAVLVILLRARSYVSKVSKEFSLGRWSILTQKTTLQKGSLEEVAGMISDFIDKGVKGRLLAFLVQTMLFNDVNYAMTGEAINALVEYRDADPPKFLFSWRQRQTAKENRLNRRKVLEETLLKMEETLRAPASPSVGKEYTKPMLETEKVLLTCKDCGKQYPSKFPECPYCFAAKIEKDEAEALKPAFITSANGHMTICPKCNKEFISDYEKCPYCNEELPERSS